jgi:hypothetical protein
MKTRLIGCLVGLGALVATSAQAQEKAWVSQSVASPAKAFELSVGTGYTQPLGSLQRGVGMPSIARAGIGVDLGAGYRIDPHWSVSGAGQYFELDPQNTTTGARGLTAGVAATYHFQPDLRLDPWAELGTGYRLMWLTQQSPAPTVLTHGFELARARLGLDIRGNEMASIGPVIGADASVFLWQDAGTSTAISDPRLSTFVFAGIQGRLDVGGTTVGTTTTTSAPMDQ